MSVRTILARLRHPAPDTVGEGEEGAMLVFAAITTVLALLSLTLAVDLGSQALAERDMQGAVDLAALDAASALGEFWSDDPQARAQEIAEQSMARNDGWANRDGRVVTATVGRFDESSRSFTPTLSNPNSVMVQAVADMSRLTSMVPGTDDVAATAVAELAPLSAISIGTNIASLDTARSQVLGTVLSDLLGGPVSLTVAGFNGLANAKVRIGDLSGDANVGSVDQLLDTTVTVGELLTATANGLTASGDPADLAVAGQLITLAANVGNQTVVRIGDILHVDQGAPGAVLDVEVDVLSLVTASALVINGGNVVDLGLNLANVPGVTSGTLRMAIIEPPQIAVGRPGFTPSGEYRTQARTANVRFGMDLTMDPLGSIAGMSVGSVNLPIGVDAGYGEAALLAVRCAATETLMSATNRVNTSAARVALGASKSAALLSTPLPTVDTPILTITAPGGVTVAEVTASGGYEIPGTSKDVVLPGTFPSRAKVRGANPVNGVNGIGLSGLIDDLDIRTKVLGTVPGVGVGVGVGGGTVGADLQRDVLVPAFDAVEGVVDRIDDEVFGILMDALGMVAVADAETAATSVDCGSRILVR